jgi:hypothetical protein
MRSAPWARKLARARSGIADISLAILKAIKISFSSYLTIDDRANLPDSCIILT